MMSDILQLIHAFNCGSGSAKMVSDKEYNNGVWHTVVFSRQQTKGKLLINGEDEQFAESIGNTRNMAVQPPYSIGGVNPDSLEDMNVNLKMTKGQYFSGCIRNVQIGGKGLGVPEQTFGVIPCSEQIEEGMFFGKGGGYIKVSFLRIIYHYFHSTVKHYSCGIASKLVPS